MVAQRPAVQDSDDLSIDGEVFTEQDLASESDLMSLSLPGGIDQGLLMGELWKDLERGEHAEAVLAEAEMRKVIELNRSLEHRFIEGAGQVVARLPLSVAMHWMARYGHEFWQQRDSLDYFAKRNPGLMIQTKSRPTIVVDRKIGRASMTIPAPAADAAAEGIGVNSAAAGDKPAAAAAPRVKGRRGRWAS